MLTVQVPGVQFFTLCYSSALCFTLHTYYKKPLLKKFSGRLIPTTRHSVFVHRMTQLKNVLPHLLYLCCGCNHPQVVAVIELVEA